MFGKNIAKLRKERKMSQYDLAEKMGFSRGQIANYEQGTRQPDFETLQQFADYFDVSTDFLLGRDTKQINKSSKDERDIAKKLESILGELDAENALAFDGEPMDETTRELVKAQIESNLRVAKQMARKKFTPKKHINDDSE